MLPLNSKNAPEKHNIREDSNREQEIIPSPFWWCLERGAWDKTRNAVATERESGRALLRMIIIVDAIR